MANKNILSDYLNAFTCDLPGLNRGLGRGQPQPMTGQPGLFRHGLEALYADDLSTYDAPQNLNTPETFLSGLDASPVIALDTGSELTVKAVQIFLNMSGFKGANGKALAEDGTWGRNSQTAVAAWQRANAGKPGIESLKVDSRRGIVWMPTPLANEIRTKIAVTRKGADELLRTPKVTQAKRPTESRNVIPSAQGEASAGAGNVFETAQNVRAILRALGAPVPPKGLVDRKLVQAWQAMAARYKLNPSVSADEGAAQLALNADTLSTLRVKARNVRSSSSARPQTRVTQGAAAGTTQTGQAAPSAGTVPVNTREVQLVLRKLGWQKSVAADGKFGPKTAAAWKSSATRRGLDATISGGKAAPLVNVNTVTLARLQQDAQIGSNKGSSTSITQVKAAPPSVTDTPSPIVATGGTQIVPTREVQAILIKLKWAPKGLKDGKFGPRTQTAWQKSATNRGIDPQITPGAGGTSVIVNASTFQRLTRDAQMGYVNPPYGPAGTVAPTPVVSPTPVVPTPDKKRPAGKSEEPAPRSGMSKVQVGAVQDILIALKFPVGKAGRDGLWGKSTKAAWEKAAKNRGLDALIAKATPVEAWVSPKTLEELSKAATGKAKKPDVPAPQPDVSDKNLVAVPPNAIGPVLKAFGKPQPKSGGELVASWREIARSEKKDDRATTKVVNGQLTLFAPKPTSDALIREAGIRISIAELVKVSDTSVLMPTLHDAISFWSNNKPVLEKYKKAYKPQKRGVWDADTQLWTLRFLSIEPGLATTVWERALPLLAAGDKKSIKLPSKFVPAIGENAKNFKKLKKAISAREKDEAEEKRLRGLIRAQVKASNILAPVVTVQQALSELFMKYKAGLLPKGTPALEQVKRTGVWDAPTERMFLLAYGQDTLGKVPPGLLQDLLKRLIQKDRRKIRVTPANAKLITEDAKAWAKRTKEILEPLVITADVPEKEPVEKPAVEPAVETPADKPIVPVKGEDPFTWGPQQEPVGADPLTRPPVQEVEGRDPISYGPMPSPEPSPEPAPAPVPDELLPAPPTPAPAAGGSGWLWGLGVLGALGVGVAMSKGKDSGAARTAPMRPSRR